MWRRLVHFFEAYPWCLAQLCDPRVSVAEKTAIVEKLFGEELCCLDAGLSKKIRQNFGSAKDVLDPDFIAFLMVLFLDSIVSTAGLECLFAAYKQWLHRAGILEEEAGVWDSRQQCQTEAAGILGAGPHQGDSM